MSPEMFNGVKVRRLCWLCEDMITMVREPLGGFLASMFGVIILLINNISWSFPIILQALLKVIIQNLSVKVRIHPPFNPAHVSWSLPQHTAPYHHRTSSKLICPLNQPITEALSNPLVGPLPPI